MKKELKISTLSIVCVLCTAAMMPAFGASSVRSLGGNGTYAGTASAAAAKSNGATATRNGSVRATGGATKTTSSASGADSSRAATTSRLSIGKYLGGSTAVSGGSSVRPGGGTTGGSDSSLDAELVTSLSKDVDQIRKDIEGLHNTDDAIKGDLNKKQDALTADDGKIIIDDQNNISLDMAALEADLASFFGVKMELRFENDVIQYRYDEKNAWTDLVDMKNYATADALAELEDKLNDIVVPTKVSELKNDAGYITADDLPTDIADVADIKNDVALLQAGLSEKADAEDVNNLSADVTSLTGQVQTNASNITDLSNNMVQSSVLNDAIEALETAIEAKQEKGEYLVAADLEALQADIEALKGASASDESIRQLTERVAAIESDYVTDTELTKAIDEVKALIPSLGEYVKQSDLDGLLEQKNYLTQEAAAQTYLTESNVNQYVEIEDGSITTAKLASGAVTSDKIDTELGAGEMVMLMSNGNGTSSWITVTVDE